ncbi:cytochrome P450 17A1 [Podospora didyma]|uniref:Cytochrome P450 17A1 n=1 Tax=Podospora didyma TaxID=330526 RepID=A0AAE0N7B4_9PEZI|nr:cytochrome P450 17A1 [Podospora didyma]
MTLSSVAVLGAVTVASLIAFRIIYNLRFHPLAKFPGPWYLAVTSLPLAIISLLKREPEWLLDLAKKYSDGDIPIRIAPTLLLFPKPSSIKDIYWDPKNNTKAGLYGTGMLGPPHLFTTINGEDHRILRKALGGPQWSFGALKNIWEPRIDSLIELLTSKLFSAAECNEPVVLCDRVAQFAADVMTLVSFSEPWGFVEHGRDERGILQSFRDGLVFFGFAGRFRGLRETVLKHPPLAKFLLPKVDDEGGNGFLMWQADRQVAERERRIEDEGFEQEKPDYLQHTLEARINGQPLNPMQKRAHVTLLIQAGADTTGTAMGSTLRFLLLNPSCLAKTRAEIDAAETAGYLSSPVQYEETRAHLPYLIACIKEGGLRLNPPATNLFARVAGPGGAKVGSVSVPEGYEMTSNAYVVQRDPELFGPDPEVFRPERWLEGSSEHKAAEMEAGLFVFGVGPRVCLGKDIAMFELYKLLPEIIRRFDMELLDKGRYVVAGGVAYNKDLVVKLSARV